MPIWNHRDECFDADERIQQQMERLQSTLNRAYNVPFYRNHFERHGTEPAQIENLNDLSRVPFIERRHFGENYPYGLFAVPLRDIVRIHTARGNGLLPVVSGYTQKDLAVWRDLVARALTASGVSSTDILQIELDPGLANWGRDYKDGAEAVGAGVIPMTILSPEKQLMIMKDYKTSVLVTSPSAAQQLAHHLFKANLNPNELSLKTMILVGEAPDPEVRSDLESRLHVKTWVHYGLTEVPGPALAFECEERNGLHVSEDHFLFEVIHPEICMPVPEGEEGELVLTTLTTRAFPLIRFRTRDRVRLLPGTCPCGRTLPRMEWLPHESEELMVIRGVKVYRKQLLQLLDRELGFSPDQYRFLVVRHQMRDHLEIRLGMDGRIFSDEIKEMERLTRRLSGELSREIGISVVIKLKESGSFVSPAGGS